MSEMSRQKHVYEFEGFRFFPEERLLVRLRDNHPFRLMPKANALLLVLIKRRGDVVPYDDLKKEVWAETNYVLTHTIRETKHALVKALGESAGRLETVAGKGYRFNVESIERFHESVADDDADQIDAATLTDKEKIEKLERPKFKDGTTGVSEEIIESQTSRYFAGHIWHVIASCALYALLYTTALFVEIAYQYDRFGTIACKIAPFVFIWIFTTSIAGLGAAWRQGHNIKLKGLVASLLIFIVSGLVLYIVLGLLLPDHPITEANIQTYTAHGAYLKSVCYFLFLAIVFLIIPFHFVLSIHKEMRAGKTDFVLPLLTGERRSLVPVGSIYLKTWWLGLFLFIIAVISPILVAHLFDELKPSPYMNFFMQLVQWRILLYMALGLECLLWYYRTLNEIKRECLHFELPLEASIETKTRDSE